MCQAGALGDAGFAEFQNQSFFHLHGGGDDVEAIAQCGNHLLVGQWGVRGERHHCFSGTAGGAVVSYRLDKFHVVRPVPDDAVTGGDTAAEILQVVGGGVHAVRVLPYPAAFMRREILLRDTHTLSVNGFVK